MAGPVDVALEDGTPGTVPEAQVKAVIKGGGRVMSAPEVAQADKEIAERNAPVTAGSIAHDVGDTAAAFQHASGAGFGEAFGIPVDTLETGIASTLFGKEAGERSRAMLRGLNERHPYVSGAGEIGGNVAGALVAGRALGNPGQGMRGAAGVATRMAVGGAENLIQATTRDINEATLGDHKVNGEKLLAAAPERFLIGAAFTGGFEGAGFGLGKGISALRGPATTALDEGAARAVGREVGAEDTLAAGRRIQGLAGGEVPKTRGGIAELLAAEQGTQRKAAVATREGALDALAGAQTTEAAMMSARQEGARTAAARAGREGVEDLRAGADAALHSEMAAASAPLRQVEEHYAVLRQTLTEEHAAATRMASEIAGERASTVKQLEEAIAKGEKHSGVAPRAAVEQAEREVAGAEGRLTRAEFDEMIDTQLGLTGHRGDPNARWSFEKSMEQHYGKPIEPEEIAARRVENLEATGSATSAGEVTRLKGIVDQLSTAHKEALGHVKSVEVAVQKTEAQAARDLAASGRGADARIAAFQRSQAKEIAGAETAAEKGNAALEKGAAKERAALGKAHDKQIKAIPKASEVTDVDPLVESLRVKGIADAERPAISGTAGVGAVFSLLHGNPLAAAGGLAASFAAGKARTHGNLLAARAMRGLSDQIAKIDNAVRNGTLLILGKGGARAAAAAEGHTERDEAPAKTEDFEKIAADLYAAQGNPLILEHRVRQALGDVAKDAPQTYTETLASTQRAHAFLLSKLPPPQRDPYTLTPQLVAGSVDASTQYEFMRSFKTVAKPLSIYRDVHNKTVTEDQVEALSSVYPSLYEQMRAEVDHQRVLLKEPIEYEREIHVGTLLSLVTNEVLDPDFQDLQYKTYKDKGDGPKPQGSKASGGASKTSKSMMSGAEGLEAGEP